MNAPCAVIAQFYQEDIVQLIDKPDTLDIILRCWHNAEDLPPPAHHPDPLMRPLQCGVVGVSFFPAAACETLPERRLRLVDRTFVSGDLCKRRVEDGGGAWVEEPGEMEYEVDMEAGDYVVCDDWIGQITEMFDEATIEVSNRHLLKLPELRSGLTIGDRSKELLNPVMDGAAAVNSARA
ncbi:hypothetical protein OE88DRAFT_1736118 [Heliocybe sulcata]|uniref:Uncharacterized protein n=1 Tax=Heliocybe sulcata TaxID=5364 RepID=A0A5C3N0C0_9AGAM|nr:hypothetical protein OE88DRAFT_1736118 [Heliocybe sulcata]